LKNLFLCLSLIFSLTACKKEYTEAEIKAESKKLNEFFEENFNMWVDRYPTYQTYLGIKKDYGKLDNETAEFKAEDLELDKKALKRLKKFDYNALDEESKLSYDIFKYDLKSSIDSHKWRYYNYPLNQMFGYQSTTPSFLINMHGISNKKEALDYISRLKEIKRVFDERMVFLKEQEKKQIFPPKFVFPKVIQDSKNIITGVPFDKGPKESPLLDDFSKKISKIKLNKKDHEELIKQAKSALTEFVAPAFQELISYSEKMHQRLTDNFGVWALPNGDKYYFHKLKKITTIKISADEIHELGLKEVARIHAEMNKIRESVGFKGGLKEFFKFMREDKQFYYPNNKQGKEAYLEDTKKIIAKMKVALPKLFNTFPKAELKVKAVEPYREKSAGIAFYQRPPMFGDRPGIYYVNLYNMETASKYQMEALAYHEAIPGHHMQLAIQTELKDLPKFRRTGGYTSYAEGWGLYSELLPKEIGFYQDPYSDFGRLAMELWRACRLVVDTGIHSKKWSREVAIKYLKDNTPNSDLEITKGIERYFIMPGQATAYKIGMLEILRLRKMAKDHLKEKFDIREYHDVVLRNGALPLPVLEKQVRNWMNSK